MINYILSFGFYDITYFLFTIVSGCLFYFVLFSNIIKYHSNINILIHLGIGFLIGFIFYKIDILLGILGGLFPENENKGFIIFYLVTLLISIFSLYITKNKILLAYSFIIILFLGVGYAYHNILVSNTITIIKNNVEKQLSIISEEKNKLKFCELKKHICFSEKTINDINEYYKENKNFKENYSVIINNDLNQIIESNFNKKHINYKNFSTNGSAFYYFNFKPSTNKLLVLISKTNFKEEKLILKYYFFVMLSFITIWFFFILFVISYHQKKIIKKERYKNLS